LPKVNYSSFNGKRREYSRVEVRPCQYGPLTVAQSLYRGNLSVRSLVDVVHKEDFADPNSEYLETLLVAVPK
jgi:hypothetical protein